MSTFNGIVAEFPDIRIDYFRPLTSDSRPPLAYFLSHVHSDHLVGLESCKSPFIYCSPATRDILLRLEKYPHRMNFAKGTLETRKQTYRHLLKLLKAIPLECPTEIELCPGNKIRVTLFDANHCIGAVCFLIEDTKHAILYTGDIRCEPWWINTLTRHPVILPYVSVSNSGAQSTLDCIYLDTTFVASGKEDSLLSFPSKASGLSELLEKIARYSKDTVFYLDAWTFGYEDVWQAVASFLNTKIHVCDYRYGLYRSLANGLEPRATEAIKLVGFQCGNHFQQGCLSTDTAKCRVHSCEKGTACEIWSKDFVRITPIVSRHEGIEIAELGAGGGHADLNQQHELECDSQPLGRLIAMCTSKLSNQPQLLSGVLQLLASVMSSNAPVIKLDDFTIDFADPDTVAIDEVVPALAKMVATRSKQASRAFQDKVLVTAASKRADGLPTQITFPYSRHASYNELLKLITWFKPSNIFPCTVAEDWTPASSMSILFGHIYPKVPIFTHDQIMLKKKGSTPFATIRLSQYEPSGSSPSRYATPLEPEGRPGTANGVSERTRKDREDDDEEDSGNIGGRIVKRWKRRDNWPLTEVDHYSPPRDGTVRGPSMPITPDQFHRPSRSDWAHHTQHNSPSSAYSLACLPADRSEGGIGNLHPWRGSVASLEYGRISPPTRDVVERVTTNMRPRTEPQARHYTLNSPGDRCSLSRKQFSSSPASSRLAFRQEAYDAVQGNTWTGLVSTSEYQVKEEEL